MVFTSFFDKVQVLYENSGDFDATSCINQEVTKLKFLFEKDSDEMKFFSWVKSKKDLILLLCNLCNNQFQLRGDRTEIVIQKLERTRRKSHRPDYYYVFRRGSEK